MKVLLTGTTGNLGTALLESAPKGIEIVKTSRKGEPGSIRLDLRNSADCVEAVMAIKPDWVLNAGAFTAVDRAEVEVDEAIAINAEAPRAFSEALLRAGGRILQISTDYVFSGNQVTPYLPTQIPDPLSAYGHSKALGEKAVFDLLGRSGQGIIMRTSWMIGATGNNFATKMLDLHRRGGEIGVVSDQIGCTTSVRTLASACWKILDQQISLPVLHWKDGGACTWYDVAVAVGELALELGIIDKAARVNPLVTEDYPLPATRPSYSLLDCSETRKLLKLPTIPWRSALKSILEEIA